MKRVPLMAVLSALLCSVISMLAQDAPMFRGNLQHTGAYDSPGVPKLRGVKWKFHSDGRVISSPAIVAGVIYVGSTDCNLYALDAATGSAKWKFPTGSWAVSSPAVVNGIVYFGSYDSNFYRWTRVRGRRNGSSRPAANTGTSESICITSSRLLSRCRTPGTSSCRRRASGMGRCISAAATGMSMHWMQLLER